MIVDQRFNGERSNERSRRRRTYPHTAVDEGCRRTSQNAGSSTRHQGRGRTHACGRRTRSDSPAVAAASTDRRSYGVLLLHPWVLFGVIPTQSSRGSLVWCASTTRIDAARACAEPGRAGTALGADRPRRHRRRLDTSTTRSRPVTRPQDQRSRRLRATHRLSVKTVVIHPCACSRSSHRPPMTHGSDRRASYGYEVVLWYPVMWSGRRRT